MRGTTQRYIYFMGTTTVSDILKIQFKGLFTPSESGSEGGRNQRTSTKDKRINGKHQRKFSLSLLLSPGLNTA